MTTLLKQEAKRWLADVPEEYLFWCSDGRTIRNMKELAEILSVMTDETFSYHANPQKNDFSTWVRDIICDEKLADDLLQAFSRTLAAIIVTEREASLSDSLKPLKKPSRKRPYKSVT